MDKDFFDSEPNLHNFEKKDICFNNSFFSNKNKQIDDFKENDLMPENNDKGIPFNSKKLYTDEEIDVDKFLL